MFRKNQLLEALSDYDDTSLSRRELREAIAELSASGKRRRLQKGLDRSIASQIFSFLLGLIVLGAVLVIVFIAGSRYLLNDSLISKKTDFQNHLTEWGSYFLKDKESSSLSLEKTPVFSGKLPAGKNYYVQVALCQYSKCNNKFREKIESKGYNSVMIASTKKETTPYKQIITRQSMDLEKAQNIAEFVNAVNEKSGYANVVSASNGMYKVSMGTFPNPDTAEDLRRYFESLTSAEQVLFEYKKSIVVSGNGANKILAGPFAKKGQAIRASKDLKRDRSLANSFITVQ